MSNQISDAVLKTTLLLSLFMTCVSSHANTTTEIKLGVSIPWSGTNWDAGPRFASGILIALDRINNDPYFLPGLKLTFEWKDSKCEESASLTAAVDLFAKTTPTVHALIGPACSGGCKAVAYLANHWNLPIISYGCGSEELSDKKSFPTFARTVGVYSKSGDIFVRLMKLYNWDRIAIITPTAFVWTSIMRGVRKEVEKNGLKIGFYQNFNDATVTDASLKDMFLTAKQKAHIFVLGGYGGTVRRLMLAAYNLGLCSAGYAFVSYEVLLNSCNSSSANATENIIACRAYEGLLDISLYVPSNCAYSNFTKDVRRRMPEKPFKRAMLPNEEVEVYAAFLHDAALLYAYALNKTLSKGQNLRDGKAMMPYIFNSSFMGASGQVVIDTVGDRSSALQLKNIKNGKYHRVFNYYNSENRLEELMNKTTILWPGNTKTAPIGRPKCGFAGELCSTSRKKRSSYIYIMIGTFASLLLGFAFMFLFIQSRRKKFERALLSQQWKVNYCEINLKKSSDHSKKSMSNTNFESQYSITSAANEDGRGGQIFTPIGVYGTRVVSLKKVRKHHIELCREVLLELKNASDLHHQNVNPFVGVCIEPPEILILSQYCNKGSLQDVLLNDNLKLDWMFQLSIAFDIARNVACIAANPQVCGVLVNLQSNDGTKEGMQYIHGSEMKVHGFLKSSNVVIDSRWVCKVTDFGLARFKSGQKSVTEVGADNRYRKLFWTAPEHLRDPNYPGSQPGDVYSYGIILQEIILRDLPYSMFEILQPKEIIARVMCCERPPFRPIVPHDTGKIMFQTLMKNCWQEDYTLRPRFDDIMKSLKKINGGKHINMVDNMVSMMEKYTDNLEELVAERTRQLEDEKLKTDQLLYSMLPRPVADVLKRGERVTAESFEMVTIFFSDIVGFTKMASECSPFEVVDLLNDLYTCFDKIAECHNVYKVETIGDAYMVVSGLPNRIGNKHAGEIAKMSLDLLSAMTNFKVKHQPEDQLQLRIGIHSGPCVAGVVGLKMPRYCLFGDTVNYASRMESSGLALRIHVSPECRDVLLQLGDYKLVERGPVSMKGKGTITTYFLVGYKGFKKPLPSLDHAASENEHTFK